VLTVRQSRFGKSRLVPLHPDHNRRAARYLRLRDRLHPQPATTAAFVSPADTRLLYCNVQATFARLTRQAGLQPGRHTSDPLQSQQTTVRQKSRKLRT
jgi:integrase/recombinase XerD